MTYWAAFAAKKQTLIAANNIIQKLMDLSIFLNTYLANNNVKHYT